MKKRNVTIFTILMVLLFGTTINTPAAQPPKPTIYVDPPSINDMSLIVNSTFQVNVSIRDVLFEHDLVGIEFKLYWDPAVLEGISMVQPSGHFFQPVQDDYNMWVIKRTIDKVAGVAWYIVTCTDIVRGYDQGYLPLTGDGVLATITFEVEALGRCPLELGIHKLSDGSGQPIDHDVEHSYFRNTPTPPPATLYVNPPSIVNISLTPPSNFIVNISITDATDLNSFEFKLLFDPSIINAFSVTLGNFFPGGSILIDPPWINNTEGYVHFGATLPELEPPKTGAGSLAQVLFNVTGLGSTVLQLSETQLLDNYDELLPHSTANGYFNNVLLAHLYVNPPEIIDPSLVPPETFEIDINLFNVENMYSYEFTLAFNKDVLTCMSITVHDVLGETNYVPDYLISNAYGYLWVNVTYYPPAEPITSYENITLATIMFRVKALGMSNLDLQDTRLTDPYGQPIPHEAEDGLFVSLIRDVAIIDVTPELTMAYQGWNVTIDVTAANKGNLTETFDVTLYYDSELIGTLTVTDLPANETTILTFYWDTESAEPCHNYTIKAEASPVPYEMNLDDNIFTDGSVKIKLVGDVNGDGAVDIFDAVEVSDSAGSWPSHPRWNEQADFNLDGAIDVFDAVLLAKHSGESCL